MYITRYAGGKIDVTDFGWVGKYKIYIPENLATLSEQGISPHTACGSPLGINETQNIRNSTQGSLQF